MDKKQIILEAADYLRLKAPQFLFKNALVLGSGLGKFAETLDNAIIIETAEIPHWPVPTVAGHSGRIIFGSVGRIPVMTLQGRSHYYEGHDMSRVVFYVRVMAELGIKNLFLTNAAGTCNPDYSPGDFMLITDHINLMGTNPLIGPNDDEFGPRFPDMTEAYNPDLSNLLREAAKELGIAIREGVLAAFTGPSYETAAEIRMIRTLGADAACMSTVPEVITAVQAGLKVAAISCITNMGTGLSANKLSHDEVKDVAGKIEKQFIALLCRTLGKL
ncbi:purine-nucleoside phosphorylase [bacterium]|nr:purine-nucleoside phosphorylase [bacterium]